jgi:small-conductance mechanosensitive channel
MWQWLKIFGRAPAWHVALGAVAVALAAAAVCAEIITTFVRRSLAPRQPGEGRSARARATVRIVRLLLLLLLTVVFIPPVLELFGQPLNVGLRLSRLVDWLLGPGLRALFISTFAYVVLRIVDLGTNRFERHVAEQQGPDSTEYAKRARTLGDMTRNVATAAIVAVAAMYVLKELGFDLLPFLTGAGIAGLAIGFGAQTLVKDVISGFFLILENQIRVGDVVEINGTGGLVEAIQLRTVLLRDQRGAVHVYPCGSINTLANLTRDFAYAVLDVRVHYRHDTDQVVGILRQTGAAIQADPLYALAVLAPLEVLGVESLGDSGVTIRTRMKTLPLQQFEVARELRRRIKKAFEAEGIEIPIVQLMTTVKPENA